MWTATLLAVLGLAAHQSAAEPGLSQLSFPASTHVLNWQDLSLGVFTSYHGFRFSGFSCRNSLNNNHQSSTADNFNKFISGVATKSDPAHSLNYPTEPAPSFAFEADGTSFWVACLYLFIPANAELDVVYTKPDGSACRNTVSSSVGGFALHENRCGSAVSVRFELPDHSHYTQFRFEIYALHINHPWRPRTSTHPVSLDARAAVSDYEHVRNDHPPWGALHAGAKRTTKASTTFDRVPYASPLSRTSSVAISSSVRPQSSGKSSFSSHQWTTSTVYMTHTVTIVSCAPTVTDCPADSTAVITSTAIISTTVIPVTSVTSKPKRPTGTRSWSISPVYSQHTQVHSTQTKSISSALSTATTVTLPANTISKWSTSTFYTTRIVTVTSCAATVTDCPADSTSLLTSTMAISTTIYPVTMDSTSSSTTSFVSQASDLTQSKSSSNLPTSLIRPSNASSEILNPTPSTAPPWTASTVYTTRLFTVTSCAPTITDCPADSTQVLTSTIMVSTTSTAIDSATGTISETITETMSTTLSAGSSVSSSLANTSSLVSTADTTQILTNTPFPSTVTTLSTTAHTNAASSTITVTNRLSSSPKLPTSSPVTSTLTSSTTPHSIGTAPTESESTSTSSAFSESIPNQSSLSNSSPSLPKSTVTLVAYSTTTLCSVTTTVTAVSVLGAPSSQSISNSDANLVTWSNARGDSATIVGLHQPLPSAWNDPESASARSAPPSTSVSSPTSAAGTLDFSLGSAITMYPWEEGTSSSLTTIPSITASRASDALEVIPYCIQSWLWLVPECPSTGNFGCFCLHSTFTEAVASCISTEISALPVSGLPKDNLNPQVANAAFTNLCAELVSQYPDYVTLVQSKVTITTDTVMSKSRTEAVTTSVTTTATAVQEAAETPTDQISSRDIVNHSKVKESLPAEITMPSTSPFRSAANIEPTSTPYSAPVQAASTNSAQVYRVMYLLLLGSFAITFGIMV